MRTESPARRDLRQRLVEEIDELDRYQRVVLVAEGNLVIVAGPGSGKTRTVVARASYLLSARISPLRGLATITYTNQAAIGLKEGLAPLGVIESTTLRRHLAFVLPHPGPAVRTSGWSRSPACTL
jgi:UvrD/REP helicase N-terminal domain